MELTDDQLKQIAEYLRNEPAPAEPPKIDLNHGQEHFVKAVVIDGEDVMIVCSCGESTGTYQSSMTDDEITVSGESKARKEYDKHYEKVMG